MSSQREREPLFKSGVLDAAQKIHGKWTLQTWSCPRGQDMCERRKTDALEDAACVLVCRLLTPRCSARPALLTGWQVPRRPASPRGYGTAELQSGKLHGMAPRNGGKRGSGRAGWGQARGSHGFSFSTWA